MKLIQKLGGKIVRDDKQPGESVITVNLAGKKVTDANVKELKELKQLTTLNLFNCELTRIAHRGIEERASRSI